LTIIAWFRRPAWLAGRTAANEPTGRVNGP
jgi:hypothetical protein